MKIKKNNVIKSYIENIILLFVAITILFIPNMCRVQSAYAADASDIQCIGVNQVDISSEDSIDMQYDNTNKPQHYMDIDFGNFLNGGGGDILSGGVSIIETLVNTLLIPLSILVAAWRWIYIAIFPLLAGVDPLNMLSQYSESNGKFLKTRRVSNIKNVDKSVPSLKNGSTLDPHKILVDELKRFVIYLLIIFCLWMVFQLIMWGVVAIVSLF